MNRVLSLNLPSRTLGLLLLWSSIHASPGATFSFNRIDPAETSSTNWPGLSAVVGSSTTNNLTVRYFGRSKTTRDAPDFTIAVLPDTQYYTAGLNGGQPEMFTAQTEWILANRTNRNIVFVTQLGDCVEHGDNDGDDSEWRNVTNSLYRLEDPGRTELPAGIPYGVTVGNHDQWPLSDPTGATRFYNQYFGADHFLDRDYYGGHFGANNDNHYELFSASGMDFIVIHFAYNPWPGSELLAWANQLLQTYSNRRAIVVSHYLLNNGFNGLFSSQGVATYEALKGNPNLFLMLCGHMIPGEGQRTDTFQGRKIWTVLSNYQDRENGGNGRMRLYEFSPSTGVIRVRTYSPWLDAYESDADSQFEIPYAMGDTNWTLLGTQTGITPGSPTTVVWPALAHGAAYEWYVSASDGVTTTNGPVWSFRTAEAAANTPPFVSLSNPANNSRFAAPGGILLGAKATDGEGDVDRIEFYAGALKLGETSAAAATLRWTNAAAGSYAIYAVATDRGGLATTSAVAMVTVTNPPPGKLLRGPYLQVGTPNSIVVRWRSDIPTTSRVRFGTNLAQLDRMVELADAVTEHIVTLSGLEPQTRYYYSVGSVGGLLAEAGPEQNFVTHPVPGTAKPTRIWVIGDAGTATASQAAVRDAYYNFTGTNHTDLWLQLGDNAYYYGTDTDYQHAVFDVYQSMLRKSVTWPTLGNHDTSQATAYVDTYPYFSIFTLPTQGEAGGVPSGTKHYYSFDYGNIHFICLDSMTGDRSADGAMANWLREDLANTTNTWTIAFWHHPPYTKGSHNSDAEAELIQMRQNFLPILEAGGVDLVLSGHSHSYERSHLLDGHYGPSSSLDPSMILNSGGGRTDGAGAYVKTPGEAHQGTIYAVAGSSGWTSGGPLDHPAMFIAMNQLGSMVLDISGDRLEAKFIRETGAIQDHFTLLKSYPPMTVQIPYLTDGTYFDAASDIPLSATVSGGSNEIASLQLLANGSVIGETADRRLGLNWSQPAPGRYTLLAVAVDTLGNSVTSAPVQVAVTTLISVTNQLIATQSAWKFLDDGSNLDVAWLTPDYDDSSWARGSGPFGYGEDDAATVIQYGPDANNKFVTTYFRREFVVTRAANYSALYLRIKRDDGAAVYLNGIEAFRDNLAPEAAFDQFTPEPGDEDASAEFIEGALNASLLVEGTNSIAVEIHQYSGDSPTMSFDLELYGVQSFWDELPPIAADYYAVANVNTTLQIAGDEILRGCNDPDQDPLLLTGVSPASSRGGSVLLVSNLVSYVPPANWVGMDQFTYTITDGRGGNASALVTVRVREPFLANSKLTGRLLSPRFEVRFTGAPGRTYTVQRAGQLDGPWETVGHSTAGSAGEVNFLDPQAPPAQAYYRLSYP